MHWAERVNYKEIARVDATHLVVGRAPAADDPTAWDRGIIAAAGDEFTARRIERAINYNCFGACVFVMPNGPEALDAVHEMINALGEAM